MSSPGTMPQVSPHDPFCSMGLVLTAISYQLPLDVATLILREYINSYNLDTDGQVNDIGEDFLPRGPSASQRQGGTLLLSLVCQQWRQIVQAMPTLLTNVTIQAPVGGSRRRLPRVPLEHLPDILHRLHLIAKLPWSLHVNATPVQAHDNARFPGGCFLRRLLQYAPVAATNIPTLERLSIEAAKGDAFGLGNITLPAVRSLVVRYRKIPQGQVLGTQHQPHRYQGHHHYYDDYYDELGALVDTGHLPSMPMLTHAVLKNFSGSFPAEIPWARLTHLSLSEITRTDWRHFIGHCSSLEKGVFTLVRRDHEEHVPAAFPAQADLGRYQKSMDNLKELTFFRLSPFLDGSPMDPVLGLSFPALQKLRMFLNSDDDIRHSWTLAPRTTRVWDCANARALFPALTHLTLVDRVLGPDQYSQSLLQILDSAPNLEELFIRVTRGFRALLEDLTLDVGRYRLRKLRAIGIQLGELGRAYWGDDALTFPDGELLQFLRSRTIRVINNQFPAAAPDITQLESIVFNAEVYKMSEEYAMTLGRTIAAQASAVMDAFDSTPGIGDLSLRRKVRVTEGRGRLPKENPGRHWDEGYEDFLARWDAEYALC